MKNMVATAMVIRGKGECQTYINGVVSNDIEKLKVQHAAEIAELKAKHAAEMERMEAELEIMRMNRSKRLAASLERNRAMVSGRKSLGDRLAEKISYAYCAIVEWALKNKFIVEVEDF